MDDEMDDDELLLIDNPSPIHNELAIHNVNDDTQENMPVPETTGNGEMDIQNRGLGEQSEVESKEDNPFFYCRFVAKYPVTSFLLTLSVHLTLVAISGILMLTGYDLFPTYFSGLPMELYNIPYKMREDAWRDRNSFENKNYIYLKDFSRVHWERKQGGDYLNIELFYDTNGGNIFTKNYLKKIEEIESDIISTADYKYFCSTVNVSLTCRKPKSILRFFDGTYANIDPLFIDMEFENVNMVLYEAYNNIKTKDDFMYFLPETFTLSQTSARAALTRSFIPISWAEHNGTQSEDFMKNTMKKKLKSLADSVSEFEMLYLSQVILFDDLEKQTVYDAYFAAGSVCFIFFFIIFHTRSLWITSWAVLSICTSYLGTNLIYRCVIGYHYFGYFHLMVIFIILGIGADDLFVFYDTWRLTSHTRHKSLAHRLHDAYSKSMLSMLITSLTTAVAFFSSCSSPILATRSFGIFSGILVIINYISVIIFFPTVVIVYHAKIKQCQCCRRCKKNTNNVRQESQITGANCDQQNETVQQENTYNQTWRSDDIHNQIPSERHLDNDLPNDNIERAEINDDGILRLQMQGSKSTKRMIRFVRDYYFGFITDKVIRWILLLFFFVVVVFFSYQASRLQPDSSEIQFFVKTHNYAKARERKENSFLQKTDDRFTTVYITWGMKLMDRSLCNFTSIDCTGKEVFDDTFDPNPPQNQLALKKFCDTLYSLSEREVSELKIRRDSKTDELEIACFTRNLEKFLEEAELHNPSFNLSLPWDSVKTKAYLEIMSSNTTNQKDLSFPYSIDIPINYWLTNGYKMTYSTDYNIYNDLIGEQKTNYSKVNYNNVRSYDISYGNKIKYIGVLINTTLDETLTSFTEGISVVEKWEEFIQKEMDKMPPGLQAGFQFGYFEWHWLYVQQSLARNAIIGITLGVSLAFPIITIATMNIILGILATVSICCTTVCVIGVIPLVGWKLGLLVSLNMCLVVGLSVDYVVHLAEGYHLSPHKDRISRTRDMLEAMGSPVIYGALTTIGAAVFMFFAKIQFFLQFATFIFCNIGFSFLFSFGFFATIVSIFGPENDSGSLKNMLHCFKNCRLLSSKNKRYVHMDRSGVI